MAAAALVLVGCHTITEELPTTPTQPPKAPASGVLKVSIPSIPAATPTPKPAPTPTPAPAPTPTPQSTPPPSSGGCGDPLPPPLWGINAKIHIRGSNRYTLDSTPIVYGREYCAKVGFPDRLHCPVRPEGAPDRVACEAYVVGHATDTGRPGPTWRRNGNLCTGGGDDCENHPDNQFLLWAYGGGLYKACSRDGICGDVQVDR
jgi:hypothetical protein